MLPISGQPFCYDFIGEGLDVHVRLQNAIKSHARSELNLLVIRYSYVLQGA